MTALSRHVAIRALGKSVLVNMVAPGVLYSVAARHFPVSSLGPLAVSALPPILWLAYGLLRLRAIDWLGVFAAENVAVRMTALAFAHTERGALVGRSSENLFLALLFLASLYAARPLMFFLMRQLATGNDPAKRGEFDRAASTPAALEPYRTLTLAWSLALVVKAGGSFALAISVSTREFLVFSPLWDLLSDTIIVGGSIAYGRRQMPGVVSSSPTYRSEPMS